MAGKEKFHQMVARVAKKHPAMGQAIGAFARHHYGPPTVAKSKVMTSAPLVSPSDKVIGKKLGVESFG